VEFLNPGVSRLDFCGCDGRVWAQSNWVLRQCDYALNSETGRGLGAGTHPVHKAMASHTHPGDLPWVPWAPGHFIKLIKLNPLTGQIILFIRSVPGAALQMHFHPGTVVVYTVQGTWTYDEGWVSEQGDVMFEVAGSTHSPRMVGKEDTIVFTVIEGALDFVDEKGQTIATENWQTYLKRYRDYCEEQGVGGGGDHEILEGLLTAETQSAQRKPEKTEKAGCGMSLAHAKMSGGEA
jgi:2,4'-dihydroxyacetophenone dioxygenase